MTWRNRLILTVSGVAILLAALMLTTAPFGTALAQVSSGISAPAAGSTVGGDVVVIGTATDANFQRYEVSYSAGPSGAATFAYLGGNTEQVVDGPLAIWETSDLPSGTYTLRLRVIKTDGNYDEYFVENIIVDQSPTPTATPIPTDTPIPPTATPTSAVTPTRAAPTATIAPSTVLTTTESAVDETDGLTTTVETEAAVALDVEDLTVDTGFPVEVTGGDEASLRLFLRYLLARFDGVATEAITVSVGSLPANLPLDLVLDESILVVASVERTGEFGGFQVYMNALDSTELADAIRTQLLDQGFTVPDLQDDSPDQVFLSSTDTEPTLFCSDDGALVVNVVPLALAGETGANLLVVSDVVGRPCSDDEDVQLNQVRILPRLAAPVDARVLSGGGTRSTDMVGAEAELRAPLSASELALAYETQLLAEGWQLSDQEGGNAFAWSAWQFADAEGDLWNATFSISRSAGSTTSYLANLRAVRQR